MDRKRQLSIKEEEQRESETKEEEQRERETKAEEGPDPKRAKESEDNSSKIEVYKKWNSRNFPELICYGKYITIEDLKTMKQLKPETVDYLSNNIDVYPNPVEFHITEVTHVTNKTNVQEIWESGEFKGYIDTDYIPFSWWSLKINEENIREAEQRYLEKVFPNRTQEQIAEQQPFLSEFTTSPSFQNEISRFGNFRFTIPLTELMESYKHSVCDGRDPVLRVYQTKIYKQEIVYAVLVHSPQMNQKFRKYPKLTSNLLVSESESEPGKIIWKAQAICETHNNQLILDEEKQKATATATQLPYRERFYVWDHVSLAFHLAEGKVLPFHNPKLDYCKIEENYKLNLSGEPNCPYDEAMKLLKKICGMQFKDEKKEEDQ